MTRDRTFKENEPFLFKLYLLAKSENGRMKQTLPAKFGS